MNHRNPSLPILLVFAGVANLLTAPAHADAAVPALAGTWEVTGTPDPSACGPTESFTNVTTISRDGVIVNVDPVVGTGAGETYRAGHNNYVVGFFGFITPAPGIMLRYEVQATAQLANPGEFIGRFRTIVTDTAGILPGCIYEGNIVARRLVPVPY